MATIRQAGWLIDRSAHVSASWCCLRTLEKKKTDTDESPTGLTAPVELNGGDDGNTSRVGLNPLHGALGAAGAAGRA